METTILIAFLVVVIALFFNFTNGFHDAANQVTTVIVSQAISPLPALIMAAISDFVGAYFLGTTVAKTIVSGIVDPRLLHEGNSGILVVVAALIGAIVWNVITWHFGMPSSSTHALIGGLVGAFIVGWGPSPIHWNKLLAIVLVMFITPVIGFLVTYFFTRLTVLFSQWASPKINNVFRKFQIVSSIAQALAHGANDAQKPMGIIVFSLILLGVYMPQGETFIIPNWVILTCSAILPLGMLLGGLRIIKKLGTGLFKIRPIHGFVSQTSSALIIYLATVFGFPISTTQVISSSIMGTGAAFRPKMVRWQVAQDMAIVWFITIPISGLIASLSFLALNTIFGV